MAIGIGTIIGGIGLATQLVGTIMGMRAANQIKNAQIEQLNIFQEGEAVREKQMMLDSRRRSRAIIRQAIAANSLALATGVGQGAGTKSTGVKGGQAQVFGQALTGIFENQQNTQIGQRIFDLNRQATQAQIKEVEAGGRASFASGLTSLGGIIMNSAGTIGRLGEFAIGRSQQTSPFTTGRTF